MGAHGGRASQPRGGLKQWGRLALVAVALVGVGLWGAAFSAAWRHERSADRVEFHGP